MPFPSQAEQALAFQQAQVMGGAMPGGQQVAPVITGPAGQAPLAVSQITTQLQPDVRSGTSRTVETPEMLARRQAAEEAARQAAEAQRATLYGTTEPAPLPPPAPAPQPQEPPSGEGLTGGIPQMETRPAQEDANRAAVAALAKQQADEEVAQRAYLEKIGQERMQRAQDSYTAAEREYEAAKNPTTLREDKGFALNALSAIAAALGSYASIRSGAPNFALQIIEKEMEQDARKKRAAMENAFKALEMQGKALSEADKDKFVDTQMGRFLASQKAKLGQLEKASSVALARFPDAQLKVQEAVAAQQAKLEETKRQNIEKAGYIAKTSDVSQRGQVQMEQVPGGGGGAPTEAERNYAVHGRTMLRAMDEMANLPQPSKKALSIVQANEGYMLAAVEESKTVKGAWWTEFLRKLDALPRSDLTDLSDSDQIYVNAMERINNAFLRITSGAAIKNDEFVRQADQLVLRADDSPAVRAYKMREMRAVTEDIMTLSGRAGQMLIDRDAQRKGASSRELPGGPRIPPEGQTPAQKRYTAETAAQIKADRKPTGRQLQQKMREARAGLSDRDKQKEKLARDALKNPKTSPENKNLAKSWLKSKGLL